MSVGSIMNSVLLPKGYCEFKYPNSNVGVDIYDSELLYVLFLTSKPIVNT